MIDQFIKIFGLIKKLEVSKLYFLKALIQTMENEKKQEILKERKYAWRAKQWTLTQKD